MPQLDSKRIHLSFLSEHNYLASTVYYKAPQLMLEEYREAEYMVLYSDSSGIYDLVVEPSCTHTYPHSQIP